MTEETKTEPRFTVYENDQSCRRVSFDVQDQLGWQLEDYKSDYPYHVEEFDTREKAQELCDILNAAWAEATKESVALEFGLAKEEYEDAKLEATRLKRLLTESYGLLVRSYAALLEQPDLTIMDDTSTYFERNYVARNYMELSTAALAQHLGFPISEEHKKSLRAAREAAREKDKK